MPSFIHHGRGNDRRSVSPRLIFVQFVFLKFPLRWRWCVFCCRDAVSTCRRTVRTSIRTLISGYSSCPVRWQSLPRISTSPIIYNEECFSGFRQGTRTDRWMGLFNSLISSSIVNKLVIVLVYYSVYTRHFFHVGTASNQQAQNMHIGSHNIICDSHASSQKQSAAASYSSIKESCFRWLFADRVYCVTFYYCNAFRNTR